MGAGNVLPVHLRPLDLLHCGSIHGSYIEGEKIDPALLRVLVPVEHSCIESASS